MPVMFGSRNTRALTADEIALLPSDFILQIDIQRLRLINRKHNPFVGNKILARNYELYWKDYPLDFTQSSVKTRSLLMHELCHVWQYATNRLTALSYITHPKKWAYGYNFVSSKNFDDYETEKQADLLQDWHHMNHGYKPYRHHKDSCAPNLEQINAVVPFAWDVTPYEPVENHDLLIA